MNLLGGNLEEKILLMLIRRSPLPTADLIESLHSEKARFTKQGIYRVLRKLKKEEKALVYRSIVSINDLWLIKWRDALKKGRAGISLVGDLADLGKKERISLKIKSLTHLDQIWSNLFLSIEPKLGKSTPLFLYNPHDWFLLLREESEKIHVRALSLRHRRTFLAVRGGAFLDRQIMLARRSRDFRPSINSKINAKEYLAILDDYVITIKQSDRDTRLIGSIFNAAKDMDEAKSALYEIDEQARSTLVVERDKAKADKWRKRILDEFF